MSASRVLRASLVAAAVWVRVGWAQDFSSPLAPGPTSAALAWIEHGLVSGSSSVDAGTIRWAGLANVQTRATAAGISWRSLHAAVGLSATGDDSFGWHAAGAAIGFADAAGGLALRGVGRRDLAGAAGARSPGAEVGVGGWLEVAPGLTLWASLPQAWLDGPGPPLRRPLEFGARAARADWVAWLLATAPRPGDGEEERALGAGHDLGLATVFVEFRTAPARASLGVHASVRSMMLAARVDAHPSLAETVRLSAGWRIGSAP